MCLSVLATQTPRLLIKTNNYTVPNNARDPKCAEMMCQAWNWLDSGTHVVAWLLPKYVMNEMFDTSFCAQFVSPAHNLSASILN